MAEFLDYDISAYLFSGFQIFWNVSLSIKRNLAIFCYIFTGFAMFKFGIWFINLKNVHVTHISFNTIDINLFLHLQKHCMKSVQIQSYFWSEYKKIRTRNNSVFGHFSRSARNYFNRRHKLIKTVIFLQQVLLVLYHWEFVPVILGRKLSHSKLLSTVAESLRLLLSPVKSYF